jgi:carotenoid cleavage dioxygenase
VHRSSEKIRCFSAIMVNLSGMSASQLQEFVASVDITSKLDDCERYSKLSINVSPASASIPAKQESLTTDGKYQYSRVNPYNTGPNTPTRFDAEVASCVVRGKVPPEIDGTFYRTGCDPIFANRTGSDTWINSDGAIHAWRFSNGEVDFKQKYVRTPRFIYERIARQSLFGAYRNPYSDDKRVFDDIQSSGNTHILYWYGFLLVLKEDSPPIALDPDTLETLGKLTSAEVKKLLMV